MDYREFYSELGKLLYAVADADGVISPQERDSIYQLIRTRLMHREVHTDEYGTNDAWYAAFEFEVAEDQGMSPEEAFESFTDFLDRRKGEISADMKQVCLVLADRLAESYRHTNLREADLIRQLREKLFSLPGTSTLPATGRQPG